MFWFGSGGYNKNSGSMSSVAGAVGRQKGNYSGIILGNGQVISAPDTPAHIRITPIISERSSVTPPKVDITLYNNYKDFVGHKCYQTESFYISRSGYMLYPITKK